MARLYIATKKSRKIITDANKTQKEGGFVDWDDVFKRVNEASAKTSKEQLKAIGERKK